MASNGKPGNQNHLQRSVHPDIRNLGGLQNLGNLAMHNGPNAIPLSTSYLQPPMNSPNIHNCGIPPLPVRRNPMSAYGRMGMGMGYNPYSRFPTNMYSPGFGGYRMSQFGQYGAGPPESSSFIQMAEESTRPAFESIESVVEVVSSISMMLESTYHAVHSSYSAILGVVDQFSRLKDHLAQMLSILALLRGLRWLCLKFLYLLKLRKENPSDEAAWSSAEISAGLAHLPPRPDKAQGSAWPFLMFVGLVIGAPWLMFKLLSKTVTKKPLDTRTFQDEHGRHVMATTAFDFKATQSDELSFSAGERLYISPASSYRCPQGWLYACNSKQETGLIPSTYLVLKQKNLSRGMRPNSFQQLPPGVAAPGPPQLFDFPRNAPEHFNEAFDCPRNSVDNSNTPPSNFDCSKNPGEAHSNIRPSGFDYSRNPNSDAPPSGFYNSRNPNSDARLIGFDDSRNPNSDARLIGFDDSRNPNSDARPIGFDDSRNPNSDARPIGFDDSRNPNSDVRPSGIDDSNKAGEKFDARPNPRDYLKNPAEKFNEDFNYSRNAAENFNPHPEARDFSKNPVGVFDSQQDASDHLKRSVENLNSQSGSHDCPQNAGNKVNAQPGAFDDSKNSTEEIQVQPNNEVHDEAAKNQNVNNTET